MARVLIAMMMAFALTGSGLAQDRVLAEPDCVETVTLSSGQNMEMAYHLPDDYDPSQSYPVLISVGEYFLADDPAAFGWVVIQAGVEERRYSRDMSREALEHIGETINIAGGKVHILGYSASSGPTFAVAAALPDLFAGVVVIPGHPRQASQYAAIARMRTLFIVGEHDGYWLRETQAAHQRLLDMGATTHLEIVPDGGHVLVELAGRPLFERIDDFFGVAARSGANE
jgi:pimeloyl-ACP methyl ester carboxylesterase